MAIILNIDTTHEVGSIALGKDGVLLAEMIHTEQRDHAGWLQSAIKELLEGQSISFKDLDAIAVTGGPGSYTGIRVGLSSAKGLCYTLNIPMIQINTLELMVDALKSQHPELGADDTILYNPMIDARREEVWMGIFGSKSENLVPSGTHLLTDFEFNKYLTKGKIIHFGSGADKYNYLLNKPGSEIMLGFIYKATDMINISENFYETENFTDLIYSEPYYLKEFYSNTLNR